MNIGLTISGIGCKWCSKMIVNKLESNSTVTPYQLRRIMENGDCHCCKEIQFTFQ